MTLTKIYLLGTLTMFLMALWDVFARYGISVLDGSPPLFSAVVLFSSAFALIIVAGPGRGGLAAMKNIYTWLFAIFQILTAVFENYAYALISTTEANVLFRVSILLSLLMAWAAFGRKPDKHDWIGSIIVAIGILYMCATLNENIRFFALLNIGISSIFFVARTFVAETHPVAAYAPTIRDQCRVTGIVLLCTSALFVVFYAIIGLIFDNIGASSAAGNLPTLKDFQNGPALFAGFICGVFVVSSAKFLYFYLSRKITTENYMIIGAFLPLTTLIVEVIWSHIGVLDISSIDQSDYISGLIVILGAVYIGYFRSKKRISN